MDLPSAFNQSATDQTRHMLAEARSVINYIWHKAAWIAMPGSLKTAYYNKQAKIVAAVHEIGPLTGHEPDYETSLQTYEKALIDFIAKNTNPNCVPDLLKAIIFYDYKAGPTRELQRQATLWRMVKIAETTEAREDLVILWKAGIAHILKKYGIDEALNHAIETAESTKSRTKLLHKRTLMNFATETALNILEFHKGDLASKKIVIENLGEKITKIAELSELGSNVRPRAQKLYEDLVIPQANAKDIADATDKYTL